MSPYPPSGGGHGEKLKKETLLYQETFTKRLVKAEELIKKLYEIGEAPDYKLRKLCGTIGMLQDMLIGYGVRMKRHSFDELHSINDLEQYRQLLEYIRRQGKYVGFLPPTKPSLPPEEDV